ncbi:hypothetical protein BW721_03320 [Jeotgalibaca sp. PTS2502]|uniref:YcaO-like family protein n=1 Tax=Jeotgalibaca sp. PTS2502 TaxID=1903686 RepID=UPI000973561E|nr:YcaO-like family protein [Jeotgalibaca sp. PTS2502]APZ48781.1 hypothetical protein BW721_03320 [Jeotgalibaca sp. PTS2502]HIY57858.1 YcaO-like family protein [Candidatus Tetragenococcus pullicola]
MRYDPYDIPLINELYSYQNDNDRVISSFFSGEIKVFYCEPTLLEEVLLYVDGNNTFEEIENIFKNRYSIEEVSNFLLTILNEGIIKITQNNFTTKKVPRMLVIGDGAFSNEFYKIKESFRTTTLKFLEDTFIYDFDVAIFAPSDCTYTDLLSVNKKLYNYNKPFVQVNFNGIDIMAGPLVIPKKSVCLECIISSKLKNINTHIPCDEKIEINDLKKLKYSYNISSALFEFHESVIPHLANKVYDEITMYFNGFSSELINCQYFFKTSTLCVDKVEKLPTTYCDFCKGINKNYIKIDTETNLKQILSTNSPNLSYDTIKYQTGGIRSKSESETKEILDTDLKKLGSKIRIEFDDGNPFRDIAPSFSAYFDEMSTCDLPYILKSDRGAGKGLTKSQAYFSAGFEMIEHISRQYTGDIPIIAARYRDIKKFAIDMPHLARTIMNTNTAYDKFDENIETDWVVATSLSGTGKKLVPAFLVFMFDVELKGTLFGTASTGVASGATLEDAILHGLFEVIEHDAWIIGQANPYTLPIVDYTSSSSEKVKEIVAKVKSMGYDIITRDYTNDLTIPVFRTYITNREDFSQYSYNGFGCHVSSEIALERSITEAAQFCDSLFGGSESSSITRNVLSSSLVNLYNQHFVVNKDVLGKTDGKTLIGKSVFEFNSSYDLIQKITRLIKEKIGGDVYYVELTKPGMNVKVVRTIVTGDIQRMNHPIISASPRLFEFGVRCGYSDKKTTYEELFMGNYQH